MKMPFCSMCGRGCPVAEQQFDRCPRCLDRLTETMTEATPWPGAIEGIRSRQAALYPAEQRNR
jgi:hypothetical protein